MIHNFIHHKGCDELGSVGDGPHVQGLQGEGGGAVPGHGDMWTVG